MQRSLLIAAGVSLIATSALAQPAARRRPAPPVQTPAPAPTPPPPPAPRVDMSRICGNRSAILAQEQQQLEQARAQLSGMDAEILQLRSRIDELTRQRAEQDRISGAYAARVTASQQSYQRECSEIDTCGQFQTAAADLDKRGDLLERTLGEIGGDIRNSRKTIDALDARIGPLRREYSDKRCNDLVAGETSQETIDRCSGIFSEWNRLQGELNRENRQLDTLKSRYQEQFTELRNVEARAAQNEQELARRCMNRPRPAHVVARNYGEVRVRAEGLGRDLDKLIADVSRLRGIRITVEARP